MDNNAYRTVFTVGEQDHCSATHFLTYEINDENTVLYPNFIVIPDSYSVKCSKCDVKFGQYFVLDAKCPCGITVPGPIIKIQANKVDCTNSNDTSLSLTQLAQRAAQEVEELKRVELQLQEQALLEGSNKTNKKKSRMKHERGIGNYSQFRNKSFKPSYSRTNNYNKLPESLVVSGTVTISGVKIQGNVNNPDSHAVGEEEDSDYSDGSGK